MGEQSGVVRLQHRASQGLQMRAELATRGCRSARCLQPVSCNVSLAEIVLDAVQRACTAFCEMSRCGSRHLGFDVAAFREASYQHRDVTRATACCARQHGMHRPRPAQTPFVVHEIRFAAQPSRTRALIRCRRRLRCG